MRKRVSLIDRCLSLSQLAAHKCGFRPLCSWRDDIQNTGFKTSLKKYVGNITDAAALFFLCSLWCLVSVNLHKILHMLNNQ